ncbi:hypothetical protein YB2330_002340 [Saitoella coloradoensis]
MAIFQKITFNKKIAAVVSGADNITIINPYSDLIQRDQAKGIPPHHGKATKKTLANRPHPRSARCQGAMKKMMKKQDVAGKKAKIEVAKMGNEVKVVVTDALRREARLIPDMVYASVLALSSVPPPPPDPL